MAAIITEKFRLNNAKQFVEDITQSSSVAYSLASSAGASSLASSGSFFGIAF